MGLVQFVSGPKDTYQITSPRLESALRQVKLSSEAQLRPFAKAARVVFSVVTATAATLSITIVTRSTLAIFDCTLTQPRGSGFAAGAFQAVIGALTWGVLISAWLSCWLVLPERALDRKGGSFVTSSAAGLAGGALVTAALLFAQGPATLYNADWIPSATSQITTAFTETGLAWSMVILGTALGFGCCLTTLLVMSASGWRGFVARAKATNFPSAARLFGAVFGRTLKDGLAGFVPVMALAGTALWYVIRQTEPSHLLPRLLGECMSILCGGIGIVVGLLFGFVLLRTGIVIPGEKD
jgi:hypothetical protein